MQTLHTFNASARQHPELAERLIRCSTEGDALLLIGDGTYNLNDENFLQSIRQKKLSLHVVTIDAKARGLQGFPTQAIETNDALFVELSCQHSKVVSWFP